MNCCSPQRGLNQLFSPALARHEAGEFRRKGLGKRDRQLLRVLTQRPLQGATVLEVGGGVGGLEIELLRAGAAHAMNVDIAQAYVDSARELARSLGYAATSEQRVLDFAQAAAQVEPADIVVMNRVVCCYPDMPRLTGAAAERAARRLVMSFPNGRWWTRVTIWAANAGFRIARVRFHIFTHRPDRIVATAEAAGLKTSLNQPGFFWQLVALERPA
jgi:2-polyprenyl-3-methyl-5-hydroxy-6-metoxy-1,4-benzoquinol methylase